MTATCAGASATVTMLATSPCNHVYGTRRHRPGQNVAAEKVARVWRHRADDFANESSEISPIRADTA
jgi:hypothetical protein